MFGFNKDKKSDSAKSVPPRPAEESARKLTSAALADGGLILRRLWVSERAIKLNEQGQYVFAVDSSATKPAIKRVVEKLYGVAVEAVNIINTKSKAKVFRGRAGRQAGFKKAIVRLREGQKIEVFPK